MRPRIVDFLNLHFHTGLFSYIIPDPAFVYAIMLGVGIIIFSRRCDKTGLGRNHATGIALWAAVAALLGARIFYLLQNIGFTIQHPSVLLEINGATVSFGVYLGGITGIILYSRIYRVMVWTYADVIASVLGIGPMIGRMACFLNGDDYGKLSNAPWAVRFPHGSYPFLDHVEKGWISPMADLSLPIHPVQLYGCIKGLMLFLLFTYLWRKNIFKPGALFFLFWIAYSICRFFLEYFRGDDDRGRVGVFSTGQFFSILIFIASVACISIIYKWKIRNSLVIEKSSYSRTNAA